MVPRTPPSPAVLQMPSVPPRAPDPSPATDLTALTQHMALLLPGTLLKAGVPGPGEAMQLRGCGEGPQPHLPGLSRGPGCPACRATAQLCASGTCSCWGFLLVWDFLLLVPWAAPRSKHFLPSTLQGPELLGPRLHPVAAGQPAGGQAPLSALPTPAVVSGTALWAPGPAVPGRRLHAVPPSPGHLCILSFTLADHRALTAEGTGPHNGSAGTPPGHSPPQHAPPQAHTAAYSLPLKPKGLHLLHQGPVGFKVAPVCSDTKALRDGVGSSQSPCLQGLRSADHPA